MLEITFTELLIFITSTWVILRIIFGIKNKKVDIKYEGKLLTVYLCIVVISRIVYFPLELKNGHIDALIFAPDRIVPFRINTTPVIHMFDSYDGWLINIVGNITMFIPVGICWPFCFKKLDNIKKTVLAGFGFTLFIEISQLLFYDRCSDIDDLMLNTAGVLLGAVSYFLVRDISIYQKKELEIG